MGKHDMKSTVFAGVALLAGAMPLLAAPVPAPAPAAAPQAMPDVTFAMVKAQADTWWDKMDANHDGRIDAADRDARLLQRFDKWDTNHDGMISKDEFLAFVHAREAKWREHRAGGPEGPPPGPGGWDHHGPGRREDRVVAMAIIMPALRQAHKDGVITRAAFDAAVKARFDMLDANQDGMLTRAELRAARHGGWHHRWHRGWGDRGGQWGHGAMPPPPPPPHGQ